MGMLLLGGECPIAIEEGTGKGGKGGKKGKWGDKGGGAGQVMVSLQDGWVKFQTDRATADQIQSLRTSLQSAFQGFCQKPDLIPPAPVLELLDQVAAMISGLSSAVLKARSGRTQEMEQVHAMSRPRSHQLTDRHQ